MLGSILNSKWYFALFSEKSNKISSNALVQIFYWALKISKPRNQMLKVLMNQFMDVLCIVTLAGTTTFINSCFFSKMVSLGSKRKCNLLNKGPMSLWSHGHSYWRIAYKIKGVYVPNSYLTSQLSKLAV